MKKRLQPKWLLSNEVFTRILELYKVNAITTGNLQRNNKRGSKMYSKLLDVLEDLCLTPAPSGFENEMAFKVAEYIKPYCSEVEIDNIGNVIGKIPGRNSSLKPVLINAHMDRIGFIVSNICEDGYLLLKKIGFVNEKVLPGSILSIRTTDEKNWLPVVVGTKCSHLLTPEEQVRTQGLHELMIDVGANNVEEVKEMGIDIGCPGVYLPSFTRLTKTRVCGTALDNCGSVAALIETASILSKNTPERDIYISGNAWEEYNQRGAAFLIRRFKPIAAISLDMLLAGDTPDVRGQFQGTLGSGPMASYFNFFDHPVNGTIAHPGLYKLALKAAEQLGIGIQKYVCDNSLGDNAYSQLQADGPACIEIGAPVRYAHSSCEVADISDIYDVSRLIAEMGLKIESDFQQCRFSRS